MKNFAYSITIGFALVLLLIISGVFYTVDETEQVIITQFGDPVGDPVVKAGLHMKMPFIQHVNRFEKRILEWDGEPNQIPTRDKRYIWVDTTARWRIVDPLMFMRTCGNETVAQARLDDVLDAAARDVISEHKLVEAIRNTNALIDRKKDQPDNMSDLDIINTEDTAMEEVFSGREALTRNILKRGADRLAEFGIELVDIRIKRINYVQEVLRKVYDRMISERKRAAEQYRSMGQGKKAEIEGKRSRELEQIQSEAYRKAQEIIGNADAEAIKIYAEAYNHDPEFYAFLKTLETYRNAIDTNTTLMLSTDSELFKYFKAVEPQRAM